MNENRPIRIQIQANTDLYRNGKVCVYNPNASGYIHVQNILRPLLMKCMHSLRTPPPEL